MAAGWPLASITDWDAYRLELSNRLGIDNQLMRVIGSKARRDPKRLVFAEADNLKIHEGGRHRLRRRHRLSHTVR
ncbi:MAG: hypothetical protein QM664_00110 [Flavihumibacter sp.]